MRLSRTIEVSLLIGVFFLLGVVGESKVSLAQTTCPRADQYRGQNGQQVTCVCPANFGFGNLWGSDVYTDDSDICTAAVHAGLISRQAGGAVTIEIRPGQASYRRETRVSISGNESVTSTEYGGWHGSFVFVRSGTITQPLPPQQQTNRPPNAPTLLSPPNTYQPSVGVNPQQPYVQLTWQNNGDPDNDPLSFALDIRYWDAAAQVWKPLFNEYVQGTSFTLTPPRLAYNTYYSWGVVAVESGKSNPQRTPTNWSYFLTGPGPQGGAIIEIQP